MIPNKVRFDLDLQDLPAKATQLPSEALGLSVSGGNSQLRAINSLREPPTHKGIFVAE
ncbi:MAG: hypothetical protein HC764_19970 [Pleurocapsa sp. CRU_1_2]|nr:hypothetical protein [Pleurocapsa sp. CRU_1_2]